MIFEGPNLPEHALYRTAPLLPSRVRYDAESTVVVTSPAEQNRKEEENNQIKSSSSEVCEGINGGKLRREKREVKDGGE